MRQASQWFTYIKTVLANWLLAGKVSIQLLASTIKANLPKILGL